MKKIQLKLFDGRRNQNFWFHFCYIPQDLWEEYTNTFKISNIDSKIKSWLKQDFNCSVSHIKDLSEAKRCIKRHYAGVYPDIFLEHNSDRQGWARIWLVEKIKKELEMK